MTFVTRAKAGGSFGHVIPVKNMKTSIVDSFIDLPFKGNQVGVCILELALFDVEGCVSPKNQRCQKPPLFNAARIAAHISYDFSTQGGDTVVRPRDPGRTGFGFGFVSALGQDDREIISSVRSHRLCGINDRRRQLDDQECRRYRVC